MGEGEFLPGLYPRLFSGDQGGVKDGRNLIDEAISNGFTYVCDQESLAAIDPSTTHRLIGLFADEDMEQPFSPTLRQR